MHDTQVDLAMQNTQAGRSSNAGHVPMRTHRQACLEMQDTQAGRSRIADAQVGWFCNAEHIGIQV